VPAAVAAKLAAPERCVVACVGDGGFGMTGQELATAVALSLPIVVLIFDNGMFATIRMHQERAYPGRPMATGLTNPDFAAIARAYGAHGETVAQSAEFRPAMTRALECGRPAVVALKVDPELITTRATLSELRSAAAG
jgi:acetolactate synthase-1/2/3 large subunit